LDAPERPAASRTRTPAPAPDDDRIPIWPNLKWALLVLACSLGVWWIAGPIVRLLEIDELAP